MSLVLVEYLQNGVAVVAMNRADKMNALSGALIDEITKAFETLIERAKNREVRAVILRSVIDKAFCAGADLSERSKMNDKETLATLAKLRRMLDAVAGVPVPTIAVIEGVAFGGGLELALACDMRVAAVGAQMGLTECKLAIIPGAGGTQRLPRLVGMAKAKELIFTARRISGPDALEMGLVNACDTHPLKTAQEWAEQVVACGPVAVITAKKAIEGGAAMDLAEALDFENSCYQNVLTTRDRKEGMTAFLEKRPPTYKGE